MLSSLYNLCRTSRVITHHHLCHYHHNHHISSCHQVHTLTHVLILTIEILLMDLVPITNSLSLVEGARTSVLICIF